LFLILLLNKYVISRLTDLNFHVKTIIKTEDLSKRIPMKGKDELADLSYSFNEMLSTLENNQLSLRTSEERFKNFLNPRLM
jgi:methyl-accepting chemotaxis protein